MTDWTAVNSATPHARTSAPAVTMIGGGQLARMTQQAAIALGVRLRVLAATPSDPAAQVCADVVFGAESELADLQRAASGTHALTFDHEGVPTHLLEQLAADGVAVLPPPTALVYAQDKLAMRRRLAELGAPLPDFADVSGTDAAAVLAEFGERHDWRIVLKTVRGGYDGRGVFFLDSAADAERIRVEAGVPLIAEEKVEMVRELSAMVARSPFGQGATWPVVETIQRDGQCAVAIAPAQDLADRTAEAAETLALRIAHELGVVGVMAVELFETAGGGIVVNELAMRPHNSGHWSMDGAVTSQFEQHLRAVLDYPLGATRPRAGVTVMANVLGAAQAPAMSMDERAHHLFARMPDAKLHLYGKGERPARKIGHVNVVGVPGEPADDVRERAERAAHWMSHGEWTDGWEIHGE